MMNGFSSFGSLIFLFRYFFVAHPLRSSLMVMAMLFAGIAGGIGVAALLPLLDQLLQSGESNSAITRFTNDIFTSLGVEPSLGILLALIVTLFVLKAALFIVAMTLVGFTVASVTMQFRLDLLRAITRAKWPYFVRQRTGTFATAISTQPDRASDCYVQSCEMVAAAIEATVLLCMAMTIAWEITVVAFIVGLLILGALSGLLKVTRGAAETQTRLHESLLSGLVDSLNSMKPIKAMGQQSRFTPLLEDDVRAISVTDRQIVLAKEALTRIPEPMRVATIGVGLYLLVAHFNYPVNDLLVLMVIFARTVERMNGVQAWYQRIIRSIPGFWFVFRTIRRAELAAEPEITTGKQPHFKKQIELRNVGYAYGSKRVLESASMTLPFGSFSAVVGPSGAGKTTIADLIIGLIKPASGEITIDGIPLAEMAQQAWRQKIGYVPQETTLFHATVRQNITLGETDISDDKILAALRRAGAEEFIQQLPLKLDTMVGEKGATLSGGQRQRIAIARALVRDPALLVLDEATTALDPTTEAGICATLRQLSGEVTILAISHQHAMRDAADTVYELNGGALTRIAA